MKSASRLAIVDHLTGLYNRRYFDKILKHSITEAKRYKKQFSLLMIDINKFKMVNDKYGHMAGDNVLKELAKVIKKSLRKIDVVFRYGGDEIVVILPDIATEGTKKATVRLKNTFSQHKFTVSGKYEIFLSLSIGSAIFPLDALTSEALIKKADESLYEDKHRNKEEKKIEPFILRTKLVPPVLKEKVISRPGLLFLLKENLVKKLILITADAGYGKTTLLTQLITAEKFPYVFYDLDKNDSDFVVFLSYLIRGLEQIQPNLVLRTKGLLTQGGEAVSNYELLMGTLINELVEKRKQELFLILDDYHNLTEGSIVHKALDYFIDHLPETVHVIISSRVVPAFSSLAKWRSKQELFELSREEIKFTDEEIKALLTTIYKIVQPEEELTRISEKTEGWITGIQLILQSAVKDGKVPTEAGIKETLNGYLEQNQPLFDYFANEILASETIEVRNFLQKSSILDILTPEVCDSISGKRDGVGLQKKYEVSPGSGAIDSARLLKELVKRNMFLSQVGKWEYKYHRLFREFLLEQFKDEEFRKSLHHQAADYYQRKGELERAVEHYLEAGSYEIAGKMIVQIADEMIERSQFATLRGWFEHLPDEILRKLPHLLLTLGKLYGEQGQWDEALRLYEKAEGLFRAQGDVSSLADVQWVQGQILWLKEAYRPAFKVLRRALRNCPAVAEATKGGIYSSLGTVLTDLREFSQARMYFKKAYRICERTQNYQNLGAVGSNLAVLVLVQGEYREGFALYQKLLERIGNTYRHYFGVAFGNASRAAVDLGEIEWAEQTLNQGWSLCKHYEDPCSWATLHHASGVLYIHKAHWDLAIEHLQEARKVYEKLKMISRIILVERDFCRLFRYRGDFVQAEGHLNQAQQMLGKMENTLGLDLLVEQSLLESNRGQFERAEETVKSALKMARRFGDKFSDCQARLAGTGVLWSQGKKKESLCLFRCAIHLSKIKGYDGILIREIQYTPFLAELTQEVTSTKGAEFVYLRTLLEKCPVLSLLKSAEAKSLRARFLGRFELSVKGVSKASLLRRETTKAILSFFLLHPQKSFSWEEITVWVWPESPTAIAHQMFRNALSEIRRNVPAFKMVILYQKGHYRLNPELQVWVDALEFSSLFEQAFREGDETKKIVFLEKAISFYEEPLLPGFYYTWVDDLRNVLEEKYISALHCLAAIYAEKGEYEKSNTYCLKFLKVNKLDERIHRLLITNYIQLGNKFKAYKQFEKLKKILHKELKAEPSLETTNIFKSPG